MGSGKTTILARRAVNSHLKTEKDILILTYNTTLVNYIREKISEVDEKFSLNRFTILNYHQFIKIELNNVGVTLRPPETSCSKEEKNKFWENNYYSNKNLFEAQLKDLKHYSTILIDEVQDFKKSWLDIIKKYFLEDDGEYILFGDEKQNIYGHTDMLEKKIVTNIKGRHTKLKTCLRSGSKIIQLASEFQKTFYPDKYEIDRIERYEKYEGELFYHYFNEEKTHIVGLHEIIEQYQKTNSIASKNITIIAFTTRILRRLDLLYRYLLMKNTDTTFETFEVACISALNIISGSGYIDKELDDKLNRLEIKDPLRSFYKTLQQEITIDNEGLSNVLTLYHLYKEFPEKAEIGFKRCCKDNKIIFNNFIKLTEDYQIMLYELYYILYAHEGRKVGNNKKIHFSMKSEEIKLSTIHSYKGLESEWLFLIVEKTVAARDEKDNHRVNFAELIYTGITRCRKNLVIINSGNEEYNEKLQQLVDNVNHAS